MAKLPIDGPAGGGSRDEMRNIFDKSEDWGRLLAPFAEVA
jgi:hypothetical protein